MASRERDRSRCGSDGSRSEAPGAYRPFFWPESHAILRSWLSLANPDRPRRDSNLFFTAVRGFFAAAAGALAERRASRVTRGSLSARPPFDPRMVGVAAAGSSGGQRRLARLEKAQIGVTNECRSRPVRARATTLICDEIAVANTLHAAWRTLKVDRTRRADVRNEVNDPEPTCRALFGH
jgi:hypothetical protein